MASLLLLALSLATVACGDPAPGQAANTEIVRSDFGVFSRTETELSFRPATTFNLSDQPEYGWVMQVKTDRPTVHWREEFTLPAPAAQWSTEGFNTQVSQDAKTAVTERDVEPANGLILNAWKAAPGDPKGHYSMRVVVDGTAERIFEFDLQ
jgi:hypothetical protein